MGTVYTRQNWNDLIGDVNDVLQNPPEDTDCEAIAPIDPVDPNHIWTKSDIQEVQDALKQTCDAITFDEIPDLWEQSVIDEINAAITQAWCDCEPTAICIGEDETYVIFSYIQTGAAEIHAWVCDDYTGEGEDPCPPPVGSYFDWYTAAAAVTGYGPGIGGGYAIWKVNYIDGLATNSDFGYYNTFDCTGNQTTMPEPDRDGEGHLINPDSSYSDIDLCFTCTTFYFHTWLFWCSCYTCTTGHPTCCEVTPPSPECPGGNCPCTVDEAWLKATYLPAVPTSDWDSHTYETVWQVRKFCDESFHGEGTGCRKCCSDGIRFCDDGECPGDPTCA